MWRQWCGRLLWHFCGANGRFSFVGRPAATEVSLGERNEGRWLLPNGDADAQVGQVHKLARRNLVLQLAGCGSSSIVRLESYHAGHDRYVNEMGVQPSREQEPTAEQLSAMRRRVEVLLFCRRSRVGTFAKKSLNALKFRTWAMLQDGSFASKDFPGPPDHAAWLKSYLECAALGHGIWWFRGRAGQVNTKWTAEAEGADDFGWLECNQAADRDSELAPAGRALLAGAVAPASPDLDGTRYALLRPQSPIEAYPKP